MYAIEQFFSILEQLFTKGVSFVQMFFNIESGSDEFKSIALGIDEKGYVIGLSEANGNDHILILGATQQGKSTLVTQMTMQENDSVMVIDPHRSAIDNLLSQHFPMHFALEDVFILAPDLEYIPTLNLLQVFHGESAYDVAQRFTEVCIDIFFDGELTAARRFQDTTLHTSWALSATNWTVVEIERFLTNSAFRSVLYEQLSDYPDLQRWLDRFNSLNYTQRQNQIESTLNRLSFFQHGEAALMFGQRESTIDINEFLSRKRALFLAPLSPDSLHESGAYIVAGLLLSMTDACLAKRRKNEPNPHVRIVVDEFQRYETPALTRLLTERRGFGASITLVTQGLQLLSQKTKTTILNNVGPIITFRLSAEEAKYLAPEIFHPDKQAVRQIKNSGEKELYSYTEMMAYSAVALTKLPPRHFYWHLPQQSAKKARMLQLDRKPTVDINEYTRQYGRPRAELTAELSQRARDFQDGRFTFTDLPEVDDGWTD